MTNIYDIIFLEIMDKWNHYKNIKVTFFSSMLEFFLFTFSFQLNNNKKKGDLNISLFSFLQISDLLLVHGKYNK